MMEAPEEPRSAFTCRPTTLAEAVTRAIGGEAFPFMLDQVLDVFYWHIRRKEFAAAQAVIDTPPPQHPDPRTNALIGATAEHLARRWNLPRVPGWSEDPRYFLREPMFDQPSPAARGLYLHESPLAFRRRLIFTEAVPLRRASMPI